MAVTGPGYDKEDRARPGRACDERLIEQLFRSHGQAINDVGRTIGHFKHTVAKRAAEFARLSLARVQLDAADAGLAFGADDVAFSHGGIMRELLDCSKTLNCSKTQGCTNTLDCTETLAIGGRACTMFAESLRRNFVLGRRTTEVRLRERGEKNNCIAQPPRGPWR